jgi:oligopeptide transport system ATP-binding protein
MGLIPQPPGRIESGQAMFNGVDLLKAPPGKLRQIRGKRVSMIFQDPMTSLNPYMRIEDQLIEPLLIHGMATQSEAVKRAIELLEHVGVPDAARRIRSYPHEFSGGMRQRVMIAMALITKPDMLIADEPTTALDVTVQAQILELVKRLQQETGMAVIWITHDLGVVAGFCERVMVMYAGRIVEAAPTEQLYVRPLHPYTRALQKSIPALQPKGASLYTIAGAPPDLSRPIPGCPFVPRCEFAQPHCEQPVELKNVETNHATACVRVQRNEIDLKTINRDDSDHLKNLL